MNFRGILGVVPSIIGADFIQKRARVAYSGCALAVKFGSTGKCRAALFQKMPTRAGAYAR